ncbi:MAG: hypothetical protein ABID40_01085, partial [Candidatus Bipolaricaulota bacterium]
MNRPEAFYPNVTIELVKDGRIHSTIAASAPLGSGGSGAYEWELPVFVAYGNTYRVRVTALRRLPDYPWATGVADESDSGFTITDGGKIAFASEAHEAGNTDIYVLDAGGLRRLTTDRWEDVSPVWSPDWTKIAFVSRRDAPHNAGEIYVMNADGTSQTRLTRHSAEDECPAWSPDGTKIVFSSWRDGNEEIYVMNADGTSQRNLTRNAANDRDPVWSPDGRMVAFVTDRDRDWDIYVMDADGSSPRR